MASQTAGDRVAEAHDIFRAATKCHAILKLYPAYHIHCVEAIDRFVELVLAYVQAHEVLRVRVLQESMEVDDQPVYTEESRGDNLALCFYMDGLRELSVLWGVDAEALKKLVMVFHETLVDRDADSLMLLWEADIANVDYVALNSLMDPWEPPDYFSPEQIQHLKQMNRAAESLIEKLSVNDDCGELDLEPSPASTAKTSTKIRGTKRVRVLLGDLEDDVFETHHEGIAAIRDELVNWDSARLLSNVIGHTLDSLAASPPIVSAENAEWLIMRSVTLAVEGRDIQLLADLVTRFAGERALAEDDPAESILNRLFEFLERREFTSSLIGMTRGGLKGPPRAMCTVLDHLGAVGVQTAVDIFVKVHSETIGPPLLKFVSANLKRNPGAVRPLLGSSMPASVVTGLVTKLVDLVADDTALTELLNVARAHSDPNVASAATEAWHVNTKQGQRTRLVHLLESENRMNRLGALKQLLDAKNRRVVPDLKAIIDSPAFVTRDADERTAFMEAIWRLGGTAAIAFLQAQSERSTGLFNRSVIQEIRDAARESLGKIRDTRKMERPLGD